MGRPPPGMTASEMTGISEDSTLWRVLGGR
jgi:hypothetical protein